MANAIASSIERAYIVLCRALYAHEACWRACTHRRCAYRRLRLVSLLMLLLHREVLIILPLLSRAVGVLVALLSLRWAGADRWALVWTWCLSWWAGRGCGFLV